MLHKKDVMNNSNFFRKKNTLVLKTSTLNQFKQCIKQSGLLRRDNYNPNTRSLHIGTLHILRFPHF